MHYNFARIHKSLRVTPAMEAGIRDHAWSIEETARLIPDPTAKKRGPSAGISNRDTTWDSTNLA